MKNIKLLILAMTLLFVYNSCDESNLDIPPVLQTEAAFFSNDADFDQAAIGIYQKLIFFYNYNNLNWMHDLWLLPDDNLTSNGGYEFEIFSSINASNGHVNTFYTYPYQLIARANTLLEKQVENPDAYENSNLKDYHKGEALFLRGYMNFQLWNYFGTAPLVTERLVLETGKPSNSVGNALLDQAIEDFENASTLLPPSWDSANVGRATSGSAFGMLGKALLFRGTVTGSTADYASAVTALNQISGYTLLSNFGDNFDESLENNEESLFEVQIGSNNGGNNPWLNNDDHGGAGDLGGWLGYFDNHWGLFGLPPFIATQGLIDTFDPNDPRIGETLDPTTGAIKKFVNRPRSSDTDVDSFVNAKILRYSDVLLMKAEATLQSGGTLSDAIGYINEVRTRAREMVPGGLEPANRPTTETDADVVLQWIMDERRIELAAEEGHRWLDLRRWHFGGIIDITKDIDFGSVRSDFNFELKNLYLPIPESEILSNTNLKQNKDF